jgi:DNA-binding XRE family transcriptional regulator
MREDQGFSVGNKRSRREARSALAAQVTAAGKAELPYSESSFLTLLGERVRSMRAFHQMSRRKLASKAGISERYVAQIEAGKANVSIILLLRIAYVVRCD